MICFKADQYEMIRKPI